MIIDIATAVLLVSAIIKGLRRGLVVALFSVIAFIVGIAAALKLSVVVTHYLESSSGVSARWLPVLSFMLVFVGVVLLIRLIAGLIDKAVEWSLLGWVNKLGGVLLYVFLYIVVLSVLLFFAVQVNLIGEHTIKNSVTWEWVQPWGPRAINAFGALVPLFKDMFTELEQFFDRVAQHAAP